MKFVHQKSTKTVKMHFSAKKEKSLEMLMFQDFFFGCAERTAFFKAVSEGVKSFVRIAVCGGKDGRVTDYFWPCGVCRQVMTELRSNFKSFCPCKKNRTVSFETVSFAFYLVASI